MVDFTLCATIQQESFALPSTTYQSVAGGRSVLESFGFLQRCKAGGVVYFRWGIDGGARVGNITLRYWGYA